MIEITIKGKKYTIDEAREIYDELHKLFGAVDAYIPQPGTWPPYMPYIPEPFPGWERWGNTCSGLTRGVSTGGYQIDTSIPMDEGTRYSQ